MTEVKRWKGWRMSCDVGEVTERLENELCSLYYCAFTQKLLRNVHKNIPLFLVAGPHILHDNARPHIADVVTKKLRDYGWEVLPHALYSTDMSSPDYDLFSNLKEPMHGLRVSSLEELSTDGIRAIRHMNKSGVLDGIIMLHKRYDSVTENQADYIERFELII